jgi:hypothetical protein
MERPFAGADSPSVSLDAGVQVGLGPHSTEYGGVYSSDLDTYLAPGRALWARVARYFRPLGTGIPAVPPPTTRSCSM